MACGGRLKLSDFWLNHKDASLFAKSQWPIHQCIYLAWRVFLALYLVSWLVVDLVSSVSGGGNIGSFFVFLTDWTFTVFTTYAVSSCIGAIYFTFAVRHNRYFSKYTVSPIALAAPSDSPSATAGDSSPTAADRLLPDEQLPPQEKTSTHLPHYFKLVWLLFNICLGVNPVVTVVYWSFLSPPQHSPFGLAMDIHVHALNTVFIYIDLILSALPVRVVHFVYGSLYGILYIVFTLIYYWAGGVNPITKDIAIYPNILDWANAGHTVWVLVVISAVGPLVYLTGYGGYRLRVFIHRRCFDTREMPFIVEE